MVINDHILVLDNFLKPFEVSEILKYANNADFNVGTIITDDQSKEVKDTNVRVVETSPLRHGTEFSPTEQFWCNYMYDKVRMAIQVYKDKLNAKHLNVTSIDDVAILKYEVGGKYNVHTDHCAKIPRTMSLIFLLNNDYDGGELEFYDREEQNPQVVDKQVGRVVIWPSNHIFPHRVKPVIKGTRYSIVSWCL
tara:strand:- start:31 stop:609 length:579 start_codon:yes stop_codon:yes gene_type:complete